MRDLKLDPLPKTFDYYPNPDMIKARLYNRGGCPSSLTKFTGNIHILIRPLRQAYYSLLGIKLDDYRGK